MRTKAVITILLLAIFALSSIAIVPILPVKASGSSSNTLSLSDAELGTQFAYEVGPATLAGVTDVAGAGVQFDFTGLNSGVGTVVGDNFAVSQLAGGAWKTYGVSNQFSTWGDFSAYKRYCACVCNVGQSSVTVCLKMNTGWTIPPPEYAALWRDTYWQSDWVTIGPGQCKVVTLDFSSATVYNAMDETEFTPHPDGTSGVAVWRLDEVSDIGFQILGNGPGSIVVKGTQLYIDPPVVNKKHSDVCTTFDVYVTLENFANLAGFDIKLTWNGSLITRTGVDYNTTLDALWGAGNWSIALENSGVGFYELVSVALATSASNVGASVLFKVTFHVDMSSTIPLQTPIHFEVASLSDNSVPVPNPIPAEVADGVYHMSAVSPAAAEVRFDQVGVGSDFTGTILTVDGTGYGAASLPKNFTWNIGSTHTFNYGSPLVVNASEQYVWTSTTGMSTLQSGSINVAGSGTVTGNYMKLLAGVHDVAVTNVVANRTWIYEGKSCGFDVNVTVSNKGDFSENVAVTLYYNITANKIIGTQIINLLQGQNQTIVFTWNSTGVEACHNYTLTAVATIPVDNNPADNTFTDGNVKVRILGDVNNDGKVGMDDIVIVLDAFGSYSGSPQTHPRWNPDADFDQNGKIDMTDIVTVLMNFGKTC